MLTEQSGVVRGTPGETVIRKLSSFRSLSWEVKPGDYASKTIDCFTRPGCVQLVSDTEEQADKDFEAVHALDKVGLLDFSIICPTPPVTGAVVVVSLNINCSGFSSLFNYLLSLLFCLLLPLYLFISSYLYLSSFSIPLRLILSLSFFVSFPLSQVDPFSSGANLAAMVIKFGYKLILVFSENDNPVAALVSVRYDTRKPASHHFYTLDLVLFKKALREKNIYAFRLLNQFFRVVKMLSHFFVSSFIYLCVSLPLSLSLYVCPFLPLSLSSFFLSHSLSLSLSFPHPSRRKAVE